jgi:hypothetical protein
VVHGTGVFSAVVDSKGSALERFPDIKKKKKKELFFNLDEVYDPISQRVFVFQFFLKCASKSFNGAESNARKLIVVNNAQLSVCCDLYNEV